MTKARELREESPEELEQRLATVQAELFSLRAQQATAQLENPMRMRELRREIARIKTVLREQQVGIRQ